MKNPIIFALIVTIGITFILTDAMAASTRDGKRKFKKYCLKQCHNDDDAETIEPTSMTMAQWEELFDNKHELLKEEHLNNELDSVKKLKSKHYKNIEKYLIKHAIDSEQPETCG